MFHLCNPCIYMQVLRNLLYVIAMAHLMEEQIKEEMYRALRKKYMDQFQVLIDRAIKKGI